MSKVSDKSYQTVLNNSNLYWGPLFILTLCIWVKVMITLGSQAFICKHIQGGPPKKLGHYN